MAATLHEDVLRAAVKQTAEASILLILVVLVLGRHKHHRWRHKIIHIYHIQRVSSSRAAASDPRFPDHGIRRNFI